MRRRRRGGPADFAGRLARADQLEPTAATEQPLALLRGVLDYQCSRAEDGTVLAAAALAAAGAEQRQAASRFPLLDLAAVADELTGEVPRAVAEVAQQQRQVTPPPLAEAAAAAAQMDARARREAVESWLDDLSLLDPRLAFWVGVAAAPVLEQAAAVVEAPPRHLWTGSACPICGGQPQVSVIAEESGEFMAGSPRSLVCGRCASSWAFPRAACPACGEDDSRRLSAFVTDAWPAVRIDACEACRTYIKTFDLRQPGGRDTVALVDDVATVVVDVWALDHGLTRPVRSLVGV